MSFRLTSSMLAEGDPVPAPLTADGGSHVPPLAWEWAPEETQSFALVLHDPDAPEGDFTYWLLWDIPRSCRSLPAGPSLDEVGTMGRNDHGRTGYDSPASPRGDGPHRFYFELHALKTPHLGLPRGSDRVAFDAAIKPYLLETAPLMLLCSRPSRRN